MSALSEQAVENPRTAETRLTDEKSQNTEGSFEKGNTPDEIELQFDNGKSLFVSKGFLMYASPVFDRMLKSEFKEKQNNIVTLKGKNFDVFKEMLLHMHPGIRKPITVDTAPAVFEIAYEYQISTVEAACEKNWTKSLTELTCWKHGYFSEETNEENLEKAFRILLFGETYAKTELMKIACEKIACVPFPVFTKHETYNMLSEVTKNKLLLTRAEKADNKKYIVN